MNYFVICTAWFSIAVFVVMAVYKFVKISSMPLQLRWELYPLDIEGRGKRRYGGSYMEEVDWVKKPRQRSVIREILATGRFFNMPLMPSGFVPWAAMQMPVGAFVTLGLLLGLSSLLTKEKAS